MSATGYSPTHVAWMQGYASALEMADARMFRKQIEDLRSEYGYANADEEKLSKGVLGRLAAEAKA